MITAVLFSIKAKFHIAPKLKFYAHSTYLGCFS